MAIEIIVKDDSGKQVEITVDLENDQNWEEICYQAGCEVAREIAIRWLKAMEERLFQERDKSLSVECSRERIRVTRFGRFSIGRRLYNDSHGNSHFLLDEYLDWLPYKWSTPSLREAIVELSTRTTFRDVSGALENLVAGVLSASTIHRVLQEVSEAAIQGEKKEWEDCFLRGKHPPPGVCKARVLYVEADGLYVCLQREIKKGKKQKHYELKNAIAYEGWERLSQKEERYRLVSKQVYCHSDSRSFSIPFWDGVGLALHKHWDLGYTKLIVLGGDDANWIDKGTDELGFCIRQLSGFHLARSCRKGWENGDDMYAAIRCGRVKQTLGEVKERDGKTAQKARSYVLKRLDKGVDWREKVEEIMRVSPDPEILDILDEARGLGAIEGNQANLFADRMKDRGMSWTISGAQHMGKAIQLVANGDLSNWCGRKLSSSGKVRSNLSFDLFESHNRTAIPALESPYASRPWGRAIRQMTMNTHRLL